MTYKDIVLKLLKTRGDITCLEQHLMNDFKESGKNGESFAKWCRENEIEFSKISSEQPAKIRLIKKELNFENN